MNETILSQLETLNEKMDAMKEQLDDMRHMLCALEQEQAYRGTEY